jgi:hypothetical protein
MMARSATKPEAFGKIDIVNFALDHHSATDCGDLFVNLDLNSRFSGRCERI